jgi:hypothetical protein
MIDHDFAKPRPPTRLFAALFLAAVCSWLPGSPAAQGRRAPAASPCDSACDQKASDCIDVCEDKLKDDKTRVECKLTCVSEREKCEKKCR